MNDQYNGDIDAQRAVTFGTTPTAKWLYRYLSNGVNRTRRRELSRIIHRINQRANYLVESKPASPAYLKDWRAIVDLNYNYFYRYIRHGTQYEWGNGHSKDILTAYLRQRFNQLRK